MGRRVQGHGTGALRRVRSFSSDFRRDHRQKCEAVGWKEYTAMGADLDSRPSLFDDNEEIGMYYLPFIVQQHYVAFHDE